MLKPTLFMSFLSFDPREQASDFELNSVEGHINFGDMIQIFIFSFFAVLARRRTHAHASA